MSVDEPLVDLRTSRVLFDVRGRGQTSPIIQAWFMHRSGSRRQRSSRAERIPSVLGPPATHFRRSLQHFRKHADGRKNLGYGRVRCAVLFGRLAR